LTPSYLRLVRLSFLASALLPPAVAACSGSLPGEVVSARYWAAVVAGLAIALVLAWLFGRLLQRLQEPGGLMMARTAGVSP
jgi:hypothetical protein